MYDLPKGLSLDFLSGRELELLCFGPYTVALHFEEGIQIQVEGSFEHIIAEQDAKPVLSSFPLSGSRLMRLLTKRVTRISTRPDGTLMLDFENGDALVIEGNVGPYESYNIARPGCGLIVV